MEALKSFCLSSNKHNLYELRFGDDVDRCLEMSATKFHTKTRRVPPDQSTVLGLSFRLYCVVSDVATSVNSQTLQSSGTMRKDIDALLVGFECAVSHHVIQYPSNIISSSVTSRLENTLLRTTLILWLCETVWHRELEFQFWLIRNI